MIGTLFQNKYANQTIILLTEISLDILSRHVPNKIKTCNDKEVAWINREVKTAVKINAGVYCKWVIRGRDPNTRDKIREVQNLTKKMIKQAKQNYFNKLGETLSNPDTGHKPF